MAVLLHIDYLNRKQNWIGKKFLEIKETLETGETKCTYRHWPGILASHSLGLHIAWSSYMAQNQHLSHNLPQNMSVPKAELQQNGGNSAKLCHKQICKKEVTIFG